MDCSGRAADRLSARRWVGRVGLVVASVAALAISGAPSAHAATYSVTATVTVGMRVYTAAVDPTTNKLYVINPDDDAVTVINGATNTVTTTVPVGAGPQGVAVNPSTHTVYVTNTHDDTVSVINGATNTVTATVPVGDSPFGVAVNPVTNTVYVTDVNGSAVSVINGAANTVATTVSVGISPFGVAVNPATNTVYVTTQFDSTVTVIDGATNTVTTSIFVAGNLAHVAVNPTTNTVYVSDYAVAGPVWVIDGTTNTITTSIPAGGNLWGLAADPASDTIYVSGPSATTVAVIDRGTNAVIATVPVGSAPSGLAFNPTTHTLYVANQYDGTVSVIRQSVPAVVKAPTQSIDVTRVAGADRHATAVAASQANFPAGGAGAVVLASGSNYPDALVGVPLASAKNAPLLLTTGATVPDATLAELARVLPAGGTVYLLGGVAAIPATVATQLTSLGYRVSRIAGADRFRTAVAVADALGSPSDVLLASGEDFPDALTAGPAAAHVGGVVLLTNGNAMAAATSEYLSAHPGKLFAIGGSAAAAGPGATRVVGADRYETAAKVAAKFFTGPTTVGVASGLTFADALPGGTSPANVDGPLLLTHRATLPASTSTYLASVKTSLMTVKVIGGPAALPDSTMAAIRGVFGQ